jgi:hypothetical protein
VIHIPRERIYEPSPLAIPDREIPLLPEKHLELAALNLGRDLDVQNRPSIVRARALTSPKKSKAKRFLKAITGYRTADDLNEKILKGLRYQFNAERVEMIVDQAFTIRQSKDPYANRPELYELYETGEIDEALEASGTRWVIGRPKIRN